MTRRAHEASLSPIGLMSLGFLQERPMHAYEMYRLAVLRRDDKLVKVAPGSLYRAVYALVDAGLARPARTETEGARPERTIFEITSTGSEVLKARVEHLIAEPVPEYPVFPLALSEIHLLEPATAVAALRARIEALRVDHAHRSTVFDTVRRKGVPEHFWFDSVLAQRLVEAELEALTDMTHRIESGAVPWDARLPRPHELPS